MVSGHAYGKALRTVKTCVGSEWCRFGTQDSTGLGIKLEKMCWGSWTPHKVKLAVSGCPRNCAEATIKDFGVVCVEAGYDIHVGGNGGVKVRVTDPLVRGRDRGRGAGICRRLHAALSRGSALPGAHRALDRACRHRLCEDARWSRTPKAAQRCMRRFLYSQTLRRRAIPGPSAPPAPMRMNSTAPARSGAMT